MISIKNLIVESNLTIDSISLLIRSIHINIKKNLISLSNSSIIKILLECGNCFFKNAFLITFFAICYGSQRFSNIFYKQNRPTFNGHRVSEIFPSQA